MDPTGGLREFMQTYNQISDDCFSNCVYSFNARDLTNEEIVCVDKCIQRIMNSRMRSSKTFADIQYKKMQGIEAPVEKEEVRKPMGQGPFSRLL